MQIRMNDVELNDTPKFLTKNPISKTHAISGLDQDDHEYIIPFTLCSVTSYIPTCKPSREEFDTCPRIDLTCELPEWDPHSETFKQQEGALLDNKWLVHDAPTPVERGQSRRFISTLDTSETTTLFPHEDDPVHDLGAALADNINVSSIHTAKDRRPKLNALDLAQRWGISIEKAWQTIVKTTQHDLQSVLHPMLSQWYRTNDCQFWYRCLPVDLYTDTLESRTASHRGNNYAQVFAHHNTWCKAYPNKNKRSSAWSIILVVCSRWCPKQDDHGWVKRAKYGWVSM